MSATGFSEFWAINKKKEQDAAENAALSDFEALQITENKKNQYAAENAALSRLIYKRNSKKDLKDMQIVRFGDVAIAIHRPKNMKGIPSGGLGSVYCAYPILRNGLMDKSVKLAVKILKETQRTVANDENGIVAKNKNSDAAVMTETRNAKAVFSARTTRIPAREKSPEGDTIYETAILMSAAPGKNLLALLTDENFTKTLTPERRIALAINVIKAYYALHKKGVYHGDIKPENILVNPQTLELTIIDLDTKVRTLETLAPEDYKFALTHNYCYPEATEKADIYSIAQGVLIPVLAGDILCRGAYPSKGQWCFDNHKINDNEKKKLKERLGLEWGAPALWDTVDVLDNMREYNPEDRWSLEAALQHFTWLLLEEKGVVADDALSNQSQAHRQQLWSLDRVLGDPKYQIVSPEKKSTHSLDFWSSKTIPESARDQTHLPNRRPALSGLTK